MLRRLCSLSFHTRENYLPGEIIMKRLGDGLQFPVLLCPVGMLLEQRPVPAERTPNSMLLQSTVMSIITPHLQVPTRRLSSISDIVSLSYNKRRENLLTSSRTSVGWCINRVYKLGRHQNPSLQFQFQLDSNTSEAGDVRPHGRRDI